MFNNNNSETTNRKNNDWIYHERQEAALCGQHALNNLIQSSVFTAGDLAEIAHQLDEMELTYMAVNNEGGVRSKDYLRRLNEGSGNVDEEGNFSIQVLRAALQQQYDLSLPSIGQNDLDFGTRDITSYPGFVCNRSSHWFTIRSLGNKFWNLNSTLEKPQLISNFRLAAELEALQQSGYAVFVITARELPPPDRTTGLSQFWWHMSDLVGKNTINKNKTTDWNGIGLGRSLNDGKKKKELSTEKEMLQKALRASMMLPKMLPEEPIANSPNVVTIQFRFPNGTKHRRRFLSQQSIDIVYSYCQVETNEFDIELKYGFPPRILNNNNRTTVGDANLDGESIQVLIH